MDPKLVLSDIASLNNCSIQYIHKQIKNNNLTISKESNRVFVKNTDARILISHKIPQKVISIQTVKGGVGKSTICFSLAIRFWLFGARVLVVDLDQQGNISKTFGQRRPEHVILDVFEKKVSAKDSIIAVKNDLDIIPSSMRNATLNQYMLAYGINEGNAIKNILRPLKKLYDIILIDCPPAIGPSVTAATIASDLVIAPLDPDDYAVDGVNYCYEEVKKINLERGEKIGFRILLNKYDARTILSSNIISQLQKNNIYNDCLFESIIGVSQEYPKTKANGTTIFDTARQGKACQDIDSLAREILGWPLPSEETK